MDFGGGMAVGIAVGMGSGIATGISTGQAQCRKKLEQHIEQNGITLQDRYGKPLKTDEFLTAALGRDQPQCHKQTKLGLLLVGIAVLIAVAVAVYFLR